jgi:ribosomal protein S18 acetylase RimI-like enzyme
MDIQLVTVQDAEALAALHATSWKTAYRGILSDEYLDTEVDAERALRWQERFARDLTHSFGLAARVNGDIVGFAWVDMDDDTVFGHLLDNLHVHPQLKGKGHGRALMARIAAEVRSRSANPSLFLWVYEENQGARAFYDRMRGVAVDRQQVTTIDGRTAWQWRYAWSDVAVLTTT